jgi:putative serine protease PepD
VLAVLVAVLLVATGSGLFGGWVATRLDDDPVMSTGSGQLVRQAEPSSLSNVVAQVEPSVVSVQAGPGGGSGVVLDTDGHILTNHHVVAAAGGEQLAVTFSDGSSQPASVVGTDPRSDLAVVQVVDGAGLTPASFADSDAVRTGDQVLALGSPLGLSGSVTAGIVSAKNRTIEVGAQSSAGVASISGMIQTDAPINPGNSGGALVNAGGEVIGINSAIATAGDSQGNIGVGFAIPANTAEQVAGQLIAGEQVSHPYLGVTVGDAPDGGALVQSVAPGSPAAEAGLRQADVITRVGDAPVQNADDLVAAVQRGQAGDRVEVTVDRGGAEQQLPVTLAEAPAEAPAR